MNRVGAGAIITATLVVMGACSSESADPASSSKAASWSLDVRDAMIDGHAPSDVLVYLDRDAAALDSTSLPAAREARANEVNRRLLDHATRSQGPLLAWLAQQNADVHPFHIVNAVLVKNASPALLRQLARRPDVERMDLDHRIQVLDEVEKPSVTTAATGSVQWGIVKTRAPEVWAKGIQGEGVVVGIIDTGVNLGHEALADSFAGAWADPYYNTPAPTDQQGHGSHNTGTILGRKNGIGMAPKARWIACRGLDHQGSGTESALTSCAQFMITSNPRPNVVFLGFGGGQGNTWYQPSINALRNAGIIPVAAIGQSGPSCGTANSPGDDVNLISVGATTNTDDVANYSSRGPTVRGGLAPTLAAPGQNIVSAGTGSNTYVTLSGTTMAAAHAAGAVALVLSSNPNQTYQDVLDQLELRAAHPALSAGDRNCGLPTPNAFPNYAFGYGRIDVADALSDAYEKNVIVRVKDATASGKGVSGDIFFETLPTGQTKIGGTISGNAESLRSSGSRTVVISIPDVVAIPSQVQIFTNNDRTTQFSYENGTLRANQIVDKELSVRIDYSDGRSVVLGSGIGEFN